MIDKSDQWAVVSTTIFTLAAGEARWLQRRTCLSVTFLSYGPSSPPTPKSYRALHNLSCTVFAHTAFSASLHRPLSSRQAYSPLHKPVSRCRGLQQRSGDSQVAVPTRIYIYIYIDTFAWAELDDRLLLALQLHIFAAAKWTFAAAFILCLQQQQTHLIATTLFLHLLMLEAVCLQFLHSSGKVELSRQKACLQLSFYSYKYLQLQVRNCGIDWQWLLAGRSCSKGRLTKGYTAYIILYSRGTLFWGPPLGFVRPLCCRHGQAKSGTAALVTVIMLPGF